MRAKGFTIIELMITIAIPLYRNYVARVEITNIKQAYMYIGGDINTAYMSSNMEGHSYNVDELIKKPPTPIIASGHTTAMVDFVDMKFHGQTNHP